MESRRKLQKAVYQAFCLGLVLLVLAGCSRMQVGPTATSPPTRTPIPPIATPDIPRLDYDELVSLFEYDPQAPLNVQEESVTDEDNVKVYEISYASPQGGRVPAYLVVPQGTGQFAGVVFLHESEQNREQFLDDALELAERGAISLLIDAPFRRPGLDRGADYWMDPLAMYVQTVIDLQRAVDLLASRSDVDGNRLGYVGHSYGAIMGGVLAGIETRIKAYVLMAGHPYWSLYRNVDPRLDAIQYIDRASPAELFFQFATEDDIITEEAALQYFQAASEPKLLEWYEAGHRLNEQARLDRVEWLSIQLRLDQ